MERTDMIRILKENGALLYRIQLLNGLKPEWVFRNISAHQFPEMVTSIELNSEDSVIHADNYFAYFINC